MNLKTHDYVADFETTVYKGQKETEVWSAAICDVGNHDPNKVNVYNDIDSFMKSFYRLGFKQYSHVRIFFHNLKFDGSFILQWLFKNKKHALLVDFDGNRYFPKNKFLYSGEFKYMLSKKGQMYSITYKYGNTLIEFIDSLKLLPLSLQEIGESFKTEHQKLEMEYEGLRYPGCPISDVELEYIKNDVLVLSEALEETFNQGNNKTTIGSNCLDEFIRLMGGKKEFYEKFPRLSDESLPTGENLDSYVRKSYKGGISYNNKTGLFTKGGIVLDVNSLYPFCMRTFKIPYGLPRYYKDAIPKFKDDTYTFVHFKANFKLKPGKMPMIQIKNNVLYKGTEWLKSSYILGKDGIYRKRAIVGSQVRESQQELTLCESDYVLFWENYDIEDFEFIDCVVFPAEIGMFEEYISKYEEIKTHSDGGIRLLAKLYLNNLYGKFGSSDDSSFKICRIEGGVLKFDWQEEHKKRTYHVAVASAITGWARRWLIIHAQKNMDRFIYCDTDSLHLEGSIDDVIGVKLDKTKFGAWDCENVWNEAVFLHQKTYIEVNDKEINVTACGMGKRCKKHLEFAYLYKKSKNKEQDILIQKAKKEKMDIDFIKKGFELKDFKEGLTVPGNLKAHQIISGCLLSEQDFQLH